MMTLYTALGTYCMTEGGMPEIISEGSNSSELNSRM